MNRSKEVSVGSAVLLMAVAQMVHAHHSVRAHYDTSRTIEISGTVVEWQFRSPHTVIVLDVMNDDGLAERWSVEASSVPTMSRLGFDRNTFAPGDEITVIAQPNRDPINPLAWGKQYITGDGRTLGAGAPLDAVALDAAERRGIERLAGRWQGRGTGDEFRADGQPLLSLNGAGREAWENYDPELSPASTCEPVNTPAVLHSPDYLYDIRINGDEVTLYHEVYEVTRTVVLDSESRPAEPSGLFGMIRGRIEGNELVIESSGFPPSRWGLALAAIPMGNGADIPSSVEKRVIERYSVSDDGATLRAEYTLEDPVYLSEPYSGDRDFTRVADDTLLHSYGCEVDSASRYLGLPGER